MTIYLQQNTSEKNRLDKSINTLATMTGTLRESTSIVDPIIKVACNLSDFTQCNYMTIPEFNRSYFVTDMKSIRDGLVEFKAHVDVLSTYKAQIRANPAIIKRQENAWNLYLNDGSFKVYQNPMVITKEFPQGFSTLEFVLAVAGS